VCCLGGLVLLVKKTLRRRRAGFEPQRASSFKKKVKARKYSEKPPEPERSVKGNTKRGIIFTLTVVLASSIGDDRLLWNHFAV